MWETSSLHGSPVIAIPPAAEFGARPLKAMAGYAKLFSDIVDSSLWNEDAETCKVFVTLLALCDRDGYVRGTVGWLAGKSKVAIDKCDIAIQKLLAPDPYSRTPDHEGRRLERLEDGWLILNYLLFRDRLSTDPTASATRERVRKHRESHGSRYVTLRTLPSVTASDAVSASVQITENRECEGKEERPRLRRLSAKLSTDRMQKAWERWMVHRKGFRKPRKPRGWEDLFNEQMAFLEAYDEPTAYDIITYSLRNDYQGLFEPRGKAAGRNTVENPLNRGVCRAGPSYGELGKQKLERQRLSRQNAGGPEGVETKLAQGSLGIDTPPP